MPVYDFPLSSSISFVGKNWLVTWMSTDPDQQVFFHGSLVSLTLELNLNPQLSWNSYEGFATKYTGKMFGSPDLSVKYLVPPAILCLYKDEWNWPQDGASSITTILNLVKV